ncbi:MAG: YfiR family protein, partial [Deltaproteobacteria bacterium]|nr:YfiR family protein [Deltaproteobacteria bacterium]
MKTRIRLVIPILLLLLAPAALSAEAPRAGAPEQLSSELLLKAAYIYNFAKFVEWPAASFNAPD